MINADTLPIIFIALMGISILIYAILDGYDLGVGILLPLKPDTLNQAHRDDMIASIGPFWDANETWLVLAIGLLLIAFPKAYNTVLFELYLHLLDYLTHFVYLHHLKYLIMVYYKRSMEQVAHHLCLLL